MRVYSDDDDINFSEVCGLLVWSVMNLVITFSINRFIITVKCQKCENLTQCIKIWLTTKHLVVEPPNVPFVWKKHIILFNYYSNKSIILIIIAHFSDFRNTEIKV